ncbi:disease resistance protein RGA4-like isoform X2 [Miscanthus floridulus]|uniref:disease resistance protein RGA4-like isoform X2 n=1 Tax=Miscanthus floridulus TaxID=154761 RepID=UPI003459756A
MDAGVLSAFINNLVARLFVLADENYKLYKDFEEDVHFLTEELQMITSAIDDQLSGRSDRALQFMVNELHELALQMEDCIDRIMYRASKEQQPWYHINQASGRRIRSRLQLAKEMQRLKKRLLEAHQRKERYYVPRLSHPELPPSASDRHIARDDLVGIDAPLKEILEHLSEAEGQLEQLKVISIVGFSGLGKTVLAQELYDSEVGRQFEKRAWVSAGQRNLEELLTSILRQVDEPLSLVNCNARQLSTNLRNHLNNKRYFIVIDDMRSTDQWNSIKSSFPRSRDVSSRIVVTTKIQSVANTCSSTNGYMHKMRRLDEEYSKQLLLKESCLQEYSASHLDSKAILDKCDGQPLALTSVGQFIQSRNWAEWDGVCKEVRSHLDSDDTLKRMYQMLTHEYSSLPSHELKACLLYFAMFPSDCRVRVKRLMRRWLAEGFLIPTVLCSDPATQSLKELMDRNIIQSIDVISNNMKFQPRASRRLSLHDSNITDATKLEFDLSLVRSLIVIGQAGKAILDFRKYQLLRVLDLEQCTDLHNDHLNEVCNLLLIKYLSLGVGVTRLPKEIKRLKLLETLDLRRTDVKILSPEVIQLPNLIHLFGKFKLPNTVVLSKLQKFLSSRQCKLETLAGFMVDESEGFAELMVHMKRLRKVKIWCESSATSSSLSNVEKAIHKFIHDVNDSADDPRSLSVHFDGCSEDLLEGLKAPCYLKSLKLQGRLLKLPEFVTALRRLRELCLESTRLTADLLTALGDLKDLLYLKLIADELDQITFRNSALPKLLCLCFVVKHPTFPNIEGGALPHLISLQLICEKMDGQCSIQIKGFKCLREVVLDDEVNTDTKAKWVQAAKEHENRPKVLLLKRAAPPQGATETEITECSVVSEGPVQQNDIQMPQQDPLSAPVTVGPGAGLQGAQAAVSSTVAPAPVHDDSYSSNGSTALVPSVTSTATALMGLGVTPATLVAALDAAETKDMDFPESSAQGAAREVIPC